MPSSADERLFTALADELRLPLLQIVRLSELGQQAKLPQIAHISDHALRLVDAYVQVQIQTKLVLEPLNAQAVLYDVAMALETEANQADFVLEIDQLGKNTPVMGHRDSLKAMLTLLGSSLIAAAGEDETIPRHLILGAHRSAKGTVIGAFSSHALVSEHALRLTRELHGRASQAVPQLGQAGAASLAIADRLSEQMAAPLKAYRHRSLTGIGSLLIPSHQLQLMS